LLVDGWFYPVAMLAGGAMKIQKLPIFLEDIFNGLRNEITNIQNSKPSAFRVIFPKRRAKNRKNI